MKKEEMAARAARLSERRPTEAADTTNQPQRQEPVPVPRAKPVRLTIDVAPQSYRGLVTYCAELAETLGRAKVSHAEVIRALISTLAADETLQSVIAERLKSANT